MVGEVYNHKSIPTFPQTPKKAVQALKKSPTKPKKSSIERCQEGLFAKIKKLRETRVLIHSLTPDTSDNDFEVLEWYGDSVLYERIAFFLFKTRRFMCPDLLSKIRQEAINNKNLANCFDILGLQELTNFSASHVLLVKQKADIMEAIIGELAEASTTRDVQGNEVKTVLDELLAYISFSGEKEFFSMNSPALSQHQVPTGRSASQQTPVNMKTAPIVERQSTPIPISIYKDTPLPQAKPSSPPSKDHSPNSKAFVSQPVNTPAHTKSSPTKNNGKFDRSFYQSSVQFVKPHQTAISTPKVQSNPTTDKIAPTTLTSALTANAANNKATPAPNSSSTTDYLPLFKADTQPLKTHKLVEVKGLLIPEVIGVGNRSVAQFSTF